MISKYFSESTKGMVFQVLETIYVIENSPAPDTVVGRFGLLEAAIPSLTTASENIKYLSDIQESIDAYKLTYYDRIPTKMQLFVLTHPKADVLDEFFCVSIYNAFGRQLSQFIEAANSLKLKSAIEKRKQKLLTMLEFVRHKIKARSDKSSTSKSILLTINQIESILQTRTTFEDIELSDHM